MAIAISFNPANPRLYQTTTASVSGASATTQYFLSIATPQGHTQTVNFKTDGSGNASIALVASIGGTHTVNMFPLTPASLVTGTFGTSGNP